MEKKIFNSVNYYRGDEPTLWKNNFLRIFHDEIYEHFEIDIDYNDESSLPIDLE